MANHEDRLQRVPVFETRASYALFCASMPHSLDAAPEGARWGAGQLEQPFGWWLQALDAEVDYCLAAVMGVVLQGFHQDYAGR